MLRFSKLSQSRKEQDGAPKTHVVSDGGSTVTISEEKDKLPDTGYPTFTVSVTPSDAKEQFENYGFTVKEV